jgi:hypothetical protein
MGCKGILFHLKIPLIFKHFHTPAIKSGAKVLIFNLKNETLREFFLFILIINNLKINK